MDLYKRVVKFKFAEDYENIRLNLLGTGALYEDPQFYFYLGNDNIEWKRPKDICSHPKFVNGTPSRFDAIQGHLGDCYLASAIEAITLDEKLVKHVVPPNQDFGHNYIGAFHFRIWQLGTWYDVVVDDRLPVLKFGGILCYMHSRNSDVFWAALLEKAYGKINGIGAYNDLSGGHALTSYQDLSGGMVEEVSLRNPPPKLTVDGIFNYALQKRALLGCSTINEDLSKKIFKNHTYTVTKIFTFPYHAPYYQGVMLVRLLNPMGRSEWNGQWSDNDSSWERVQTNILEDLNVVNRQEGEFWMSLDDLIKYFTFVYIVYLGPGQYVSSHRIQVSKIDEDWNSIILYGEWTKGYSAGGASFGLRYMNPQFLIKFEKSSHELDDSCQVLIELTQRSKKVRTDKPLITFYVYPVDTTKYVYMPLNFNFFRYNKPIIEWPTFRARTMVMSMKLPGEHYCILPCPSKRDVESRFVLRIFSERRVLNATSYDGQISKSAPNKEIIRNEFNQELKNKFESVAQGQDEIDWLGLKGILDKEFGTNGAGFGVFRSLNSLIQGIFNMFPLFRSSNDYDDHNTVFTKEECRCMIAMLDDDRSGRISFSEFSNLWDKICFWTKVYEQHKDETEDYVRVPQLRDAITSIGYNITKSTIHSLSCVYADDHGNISLTDFILCGVILETTISICRNTVGESENTVTLKLEDWVKNTLML